MKRQVKIAKRNRRVRAVRKNVSGTADKPRVFVFKSNKYIYASVADDSAQKVLMSAMKAKGLKNAKELGLEVGKMMTSKKIEKAVFDRSGYKYHGQVAAIADGLRESGIKV